MEARFGEVTVTLSARGIPSHSIEVFHDGLHKHALVKAPDTQILSNRATAIARQWNEAWARQVTVQSGRLHLENQKETAADRSAEAQQELDSLREILIRGLDSDPTLDWEALKINQPFPGRAPRRPVLPEVPSAPAYPVQPHPADLRYQANLSFFDRLVSARKAAKFAECNDRFALDNRLWQSACSEIDQRHNEARSAHEAACAELLERYARATREWEEEKRQYTEQLAAQVNEIEEQKARYESGSPDAVVQYCERVLSHSEYPSCIPREFDFQFIPETGVMLINSRLPAPDNLPTLSEVKYVQVSDSFKELYLSETQSLKLYDDVIYQIALRTINELFRSDSLGVLATVVFNGIVTSIDKSTGNEATACIMSLQASRDAFLAINLAKVEPKACFRQLRGVGSSKLHSLTPVAPLVQLSRDDKRFVHSYSVAEELNEGYNLFWSRHRTTVPMPTSSPTASP